jgi:hypothetical protein
MQRIIDLKTIAIGLLLSLSVGIFFLPLVDTIIVFATAIRLDAPLSYYLLRGHFPLVLAAIYVGLSRTESKIVTGVLVGISYAIARDLYGLLFPEISYDSRNWVSFIYAPLRDGLICAVASWFLFQVVRLSKRKK